jgi:hypothetical protein
MKTLHQSVTELKELLGAGEYTLTFNDPLGLLKYGGLCGDIDKALASPPQAVVIEDASTGEWSVSFTNHNPDREDCVDCRTEEDAWRLKRIWDASHSANVASEPSGQK